MKKNLPNLFWWLWGSILCIAVIGLYSPGLHGPFLFDDLQSIDTPPLDPFSWRKLFEIITQNTSGPLGRPLSILSFALNNYFFGLSPYSYKVINLILHLCNGLAAGFFIYLLITLKPTSRRLALKVAFIASTLWLLHPLQVSTVMYAVQRMTLLCHFFILTGLSLYLYGRMRMILHQPYAISFMVSSVLIFYPLAMLSKETGVLFPLYLFCIEYAILQFRGGSAKQKCWLKHAIRLLSLGLILTALLFYWLKLPQFLSFFAEKGYTVFDRLLTEIKVLVFYIKLILFPRLSQMGLYHDGFPLSTSLDKEVISSATILLALLIMMIASKRKAPILAFGIAWFFISHLLESTVLPLELVFEHRNYLASLGLLLIPSYALVWFLQHYSTPLIKRACWIGCLFLLFIFMGLTYSRNVIWSSNERLLQQENLHRPNSARVHIEIANWLLKQQQYEWAFAELDHAQRLEPGNLGILIHKLVIFCSISDIPPKLYEQAQEKIKTAAITPYVITALDILVTNIFNKKCNADTDRIIALIQAAYQNPFLTYRPRYKAILYHLEAGLQLLRQQHSRSRFLLLESFYTYPHRFAPLIEKGYLEINQGMLSTAQTTLKMLQEHQHSIYAPRDKIQELEKIIRLQKMKDEAEPSSQKKLDPLEQ